MEHICNFISISQYTDAFGIKCLNKDVAVINFEQIRDNSVLPTRLSFDFFVVFLKDVKCGDIKYGRSYYDYQEGTLLFIAPGQELSIENAKINKHKGYALCFSRELFSDTQISSNFEKYSFFNYDINEALHINEQERNLILGCFDNIQREIENKDEHSKNLICINLAMFLNYCIRFYDRQFENRKVVNNDILLKFQGMLFSYYNAQNGEPSNIPTVKYFANKLYLSPNYLGDLVKKQTGESAQEHIQSYLVSVAKDKLKNTHQSVSQIAYSMGFDYPQYFSRFFKKHVGLTPNQYRVSTV